MYPIIIINLSSALGILYFFIKIYKIKNFQCFDMHTKNWYPSLGIEGYKLSYVLHRINILYIISGTLSASLFVLNNKFHKFQDFILVLFSLLGLVLIRFLLGNTGKFMLFNIRGDQDQDIQSNIIGWEYNLIDNMNNYFTYDCCICLENKLFPHRVKLEPCDHDLYCKICTERMRDLKTCPICRQEIKKISVYIRKN